jgi:hypothetical protein
VLARDLGDRVRAVAHAGREGREVVHGADEHDAQADPQEARQPAESLAGENGTRDGTRGGDGGKMLREQIEGSRGDEVDAVGVLVRGSRALVVEREVARDPTAIETVRTHEQDHEGDGENGKRHMGDRMATYGNELSARLAVEPTILPMLIAGGFHHALREAKRAD